MTIRENFRLWRSGQPVAGSPEAKNPNPPRTRQQTRRGGGGFTLLEVLVASAIGSMVLAGVATLTLYGARSLAALTNYTQLDRSGRYTLDYLSREIRQSTRVTGFSSNASVRSLTFTNADKGATLTLAWNAAQRTLNITNNGLGFKALNGCDDWKFSLYQRTPLITPTNILFYPATNSAGVIDLSVCKVVSMSWKCSRKILQQKVNTENAQSAQIVLRTQHKS